MDIAYFRPKFKSLKDIMPNKKDPYSPPRQRVWLAIRDNAEQFTIHQVADLGSMTYESTRHFVSQLKKAGLVEILDCEKPKSLQLINQKFFHLVKDVGYHYPKMTSSGKLLTSVTANKAMWNTLRITNNALNSDELARVSSNEDISVKETTAKNYLIALHQAGYLQRVQEANVIGGKAKYMLIPSMNTGPQPPQIQRTKRVFDQNTQEVMFIERPELDDEIKNGATGEFYA